MANMCVSDAGYKEAEGKRYAAVATAGTIKQLMAVAQFALNASDAISNFKKLNKVASRGVTIEEQLHKKLKETYWPAEDQMLDEFTQKTTWEGQAVLAKRYAGRMFAPYAAQFAKDMHKLECEKPRYCTNAHVKRVQELMVLRSAVRANVNLMAEKIAFYEIKAVEDTDHERRKQALAQRQGLVQQAAALMAHASQGFAGAASGAMGAVNNAIQTFGYATTQRAQAEAGFGKDPYFHQRIGQQVGGQAPVVDMAPTSFAQPQFDNPLEQQWQQSVGQPAPALDTSAFDAEWDQGMAGLNNGVSTGSGVSVTPIRDDTYSIK